MLPWLLNLFGFLVNKLFEAPTRLRSIKLVFLNVITCKTIQALQIMSKFVLWRKKKFAEVVGDGIIFVAEIILFDSS